MTNQFPGLKIKWGISGQNKSLSPSSTCLTNLKLMAAALLSHFFQASTSPDIFCYTDWNLLYGVWWVLFCVKQSKRTFEESWESATVSILSLLLLLFLASSKSSPSWGRWWGKITFICLGSSLNSKRQGHATTLYSQDLSSWIYGSFEAVPFPQKLLPIILVILKISFVRKN